MFKRGIIEEIIDKYNYRVRVPVWHKLSDSMGGTKTKDLPIAKCIVLPSYNPNYKVGDTVFVGYENDETELVILGLMYGANASSSSQANIELNSFVVKYDTQLGTDTHIGNVTPIEISYLKNTKGNIQGQLDVITARLDKGGGGGIDPNSLLVINGGSSIMRDGEEANA